jgi:hypothetical protein
MEDNIPPSEEYNSGNNSQKNNYDLKQQGFKALKIALQNPAFVDSLEKAVRNAESGNVVEFPDDFFD